MRSGHFQNPLFSSVKDFFRALKKNYTYSVLRNHYLWFGFFWGLPIPFIVLFLHAYATQSAFHLDYAIQILKLHPFYWIFAVHPFIFAIVFGALGTIQKTQNVKINDLLLQLKIESTHDSLTQLYNRSFFEFVLQQELTRSLRQATIFSLIIFDIDHFKEINDRYGHLIGDRVLRTIGLLLRTNSRPYDTAARWGGEEFSLILPQTTASDALKIADRIRFEFSQIQHTVKGKEFSCTLSAGISSYAPQDNASSLIERADRALYLAKANNRNCVKIYV